MTVLCCRTQKKKKIEMESSCTVLNFIEEILIIFTHPNSQKNLMLCLCITRTTVTYKLHVVQAIQNLENIDAALTFLWRKALKFIHLINFDTNGGENNIVHLIYDRYKSSFVLYDRKKNRSVT